MTRIQWMLISVIGLTGLAAGWDILLPFINLPSLVITLGGTLGVTSFSYSWDTLKGVWTAVRTVLTTQPGSLHQQLAAILQLAHLNHVGGLRALENHEERLRDPFLRRGVHLIVDMRREDEVRAGIEYECFLFANRYEAARQVLLTMGKLLPSFGLVGTLIGLVLLLRQAADPDPNALAPALAVAVLTTLYGAVFANALVLPLAAKLQAFMQEHEVFLKLTLEGLVLVARNESPALIQKRLSTLLTPDVAHLADRNTGTNADYRPAVSLR